MALRVDKELFNTSKDGITAAALHSTILASCHTLPAVCASLIVEYYHNYKKYRDIFAIMQHLMIPIQDKRDIPGLRMAFIGRQTGCEVFAAVFHFLSRLIPDNIKTNRNYIHTLKHAHTSHITRV
jgi:hypothetical protein